MLVQIQTSSYSWQTFIQELHRCEPVTA